MLAAVTDGRAHPTADAHTLTQWCAATACGLALVALAGWVFDARLLAGQWGTYLPMAPSTALALLLLGSAMFAEARRPFGPLSRLAALSAAGVAFLLGVLVLVEYVTGHDVGAAWLPAHTNEWIGGVPVGRMSPLTGATIVLESGAFVLLLHAIRWPRAASLSALLAMLATAVNIVVLMGYFYGAPLLYGGSTIPVAFPTAVAVVLLGVGLGHLLLPRIPALHAWQRGTMRGILVRAFLPAVCLYIIVDGWADTWRGEAFRTTNPALLHAVVALAIGGLFVAIVAWVARRTGDEIESAHATRRESEEQYRVAVNATNDGMWDHDLRDGTVRFNERYVAAFGAPSESEDPWRWWVDHVHPEDRDQTLSSYSAALNGSGDTWKCEYRFRRIDGTWANAFDRAHITRDSTGKSTYLIGALSDTTESKRAEEEKTRLEVQLRQAQKMESVGRLAGGVAHDFNNMLGVILGHAELALAQVDAASPLEADLQEIRKAAMRSADLTRQLLAFARKQTVAPKVLDLNTTVGGMLKLLHRLIGENIVLTWQPGADLWAVKVDPAQIDQILANLCVNARDAIAGVGKLIIETGNSTLDQDYCAAHPGCVPGQYVRLVVSDDGCGMDKDTLSHLFEPFFTTKAVGEGTGLGLATVYGVVKQNKGYINVYSESNLGTTFTIYLPRHVGDTPHARAEDAVSRAVRGHETILLVEDESSVLTLTTRLLEQLGYTVLASSTPGRAIALAGTHAGAIDLLLTDVVMPGMNGRVLVEQLLALRPHLRRLFMSGYTADVIAHQGVLDEGVHFIQKPFSTEGLAAKVRDALDAPR